MTMFPFIEPRFTPKYVAMHLAILCLFHISLEVHNIINCIIMSSCWHVTAMNPSHTDYVSTLNMQSH